MCYNVQKSPAVIFMADGFEEIEAVTVADILRRAELETHIVSVMERAEVTGSRGVRLICDEVFEKAVGLIDNAGILILPGGAEGAKRLNAHLGVCGVLKSFNADERLLAAICAAPSVLGSLGILAGKAAVCYPGFEGELAGAEIRDEDVVVSGNIITARAAGCSADFAFKIVELLKNKAGENGAEAAAEIKKRMFYR